MGVVLNKDNQPRVYCSSQKVSSNQQFLRKNHLQQFIKEQQHVNQLLTDTTSHMNELVTQTKLDYDQHFQKVYQQLEQQESVTQPLITKVENQQVFSVRIMERIDALEKTNSDILKKLQQDGIINQTIIDQLTFQDQSIHKLSNKFENYEMLHREMNNQFINHVDSNEEILKKLEIQEVFHQTVMDRLNHQEGLIHKIAREVDHLKSVVFERVSFVVDKIDQNYKQATQYVIKVMNKPGLTKPSTEQKNSKEKVH